MSTSTVLQETINRLITLLQMQQNITMRLGNAAGNKLLQTIAGAKAQAYQDAISILQAQMEADYGIK